MAAPYGIGGYGNIVPWGSYTSPTPSAPVSTAYDDSTVGVIEATLDAIAEEDNAIGGFWVTRITSDQTAGSTTLDVESTLDWPSSGSISVEGIVYGYTGKTYNTLTGITHRASGATVSGLAGDHRAGTPAIDRSSSRSAIEKLRRSMLVAYAESEDLRVIGRNLGVFYLPIFGDDEKFRKIIQYMAYCPKGTIQGIRFAMNGIIGAGNYEIYEDRIKHNNTVFLKVDSSALISNVSAGKAFLTGPKYSVTSGTSDTISLPDEPMTVQGVMLKNLSESFDFRNDKPSALTYPYWEGQSPSTAFTYQGTVAESTGVIQTAGLQTEFKSNVLNGTVYYTMNGAQGARVVPDTVADISTTIQVPSSSVMAAGKLLQASITINDGAYKIQVGVDDDMKIGFFSTEAGGHVGGTYTLIADQYHDVLIKKFGTSRVELWVDGTLAGTTEYSSFADVTSSHEIRYGIEGTPAANMEVWFKELNITLSTDIDYWSSREASTATLNTTTPKRVVLSGSSHSFTASDVGKSYDIVGSSVLNSSGGNNNGRYIIDTYVSGTTVELIGRVRDGASLNSINPTRIDTGNERTFKYPDDLGKEIVISNSIVGNGGTYVIARLLQEGTLKDFSADFDSEIEEHTGICEVASASFGTEPDVSFQINPVFVTESSLGWEQGDAGSISGTTITLRQGMWSNGLVMEVGISDVFTAQILEGPNVANMVIQTSPDVLYEYYPIYLADQVGGLEEYMNTVTLGGVIAEVALV